jgi:hypothetical protein
LKKSFYKSGWLIGIFFVLAVMLAACGEATATPVPTTAKASTVAATTAAATTAAPTAVATTAKPATTVAATTAASTTVATTTAASTTKPATTAAAAAGAKPTIPASGAFTGDLEKLQQVLKATGDFQSLKITFKGTPKNDSPEAQSANMHGEMVVVKPGKLSFDLTSASEQQKIVVVDDKAYISKDNGATWESVDSSFLNVDSLLSSIDQSHTDTLTTQYAGSTVSYLPDEKLDGKDVGVIQLDTSTSSSDYAKQLQGAKITYRYDKTTLRLQQFLIQSPIFDIDTRYTDYNSSSNQVVAPK